MEESSFSELLNESLNIPNAGKKVKGTVIRVESDEVFIDFGFKSEGVVPREEFSIINGGPEVQIGDEVEVILENFNSQSGLPQLSKKKAELQEEFKRINDINAGKEKVKAKILEDVKGGFIVDIGEKTEIRAFLPGSQVDIRPVKDFKKLIGQEIEARIINMTDKGIVVSRRVLLEELRESRINELMSSLNVGDTISGKVSNTINSGAFVDLIGIEGFVPFSEISWGRIRNPNEVLSIGQEITTKVISISEGPKITLSLKQTTSDPWETVTERYEPGTRVKGSAVSVKDFGVFVELEPGIEGLIHNSEITWTKRFRHPKEIVKEGSIIEAIVLDVDKEKKRIGLSLRQIEPSPWEIFKDSNPPGKKVKGTIKNITQNGLFVEVAEGLVGLVRPDQISWQGKEDPNENFKTGQEIDVSVINIDVKNQRVALGIKQLSTDPWIEATNTYKAKESVVTGKVSRINDYGITLELENNIEGFIRNSELTQTGSRDLVKEFKVGDEVTALVLGFDKRKRQINLSKKALEHFQEKQQVSNFMSSQGGSNVTIGDLFGNDFKAPETEQESKE
ncbi:MAG: 30S ribosomal protein S1 [Candidatus Dadabacteria bacterium]|nr:30S ribosomal protein S1 [Candidatus Dadabacteria bacterium]NIS07430.1 30S ribosomal protein S1 [Candidatus Dadabacteria bacterium]NIV41620.1 30S ribosomal protein S1 [Candidatus Dadabacteria bacterium]NIX14623.1 30S ribosomal protein S1 [Candidatus Dadabacteria bacterium]NIY21086.1 30S ribosomal protein S1 [Candidatus Dadabacteria bacterium]